MTIRQSSDHEPVFLGFARSRGRAGGISYNRDGEKCDGGIPRTVSLTWSYYYIPRGRKIRIVLNSRTQYLKEYYPFGDEREKKVYLIKASDLDTICSDMPIKLKRSIKLKVKKLAEKYTAQLKGHAKTSR